MRVRLMLPRPSNNECRTAFPFADDWLIPKHRLGEPRKRTATEIDKAIAESEYILALGDDFDDSGTPAYTRAALDRATRFLREFAAAAFREFRCHLVAPYIDPGPNGSIDLHWKRGSFELLVNVPIDPDRHPTYYGDDYGVSTVKGEINSIVSRRTLAYWLLQHQ
jgi:hypothetical protein